MQRIYFVSGNEKKYEEIKEIIEDDCPQIDWKRMEIPEIQAKDIETLIRRKAMEAFKELKRPVLVEHTALRIEAYQNLPDLQTSYFCNSIGNEEIVKYCCFKDKFGAEAISAFCYCDGKKMYIGQGMEAGKIVESVDKVEEGFGWDGIFVPKENNPEQKTYASPGNQKCKRSMRKKAWDELRGFLTGPNLDYETENDKICELKELIRKKKVMLFVGAGISASLGLPSWDKLIEDLGSEEGYEGELFQSYGDNMMLAEFLRKKSPERLYESLRKRFDINMEPEVLKKLETSEIYQMIEKLDFPVIYTTNYDALIEKYYEIKGRVYAKVAVIDDMEKVKEGNPRIMKFHGDFTDEKTIILTESQYFERMDFQSFMDIQLQADMLKYYVLFLGYSMSDINIKLLLYRIRRNWGNSTKTAYIFTATPNEIQKQVFMGNDIIAFSGENADKKEGTLEFLKALCTD